MSSGDGNGPEHAVVQRAVFDLAHVPPAERYAFWRESIAAIYDVDAPKEVRDRGFYASVAAYHLGPLLIGRTETRRQRFRRDTAVIARDGMDHYAVQLFERGSTAWEGREGDHVLEPGGFIVFELSRVSDFQTADFCNTTLIVPRDLLEDRLRPGTDQHLRTFAPSEPLALLFREHMRALLSVAPAMTVRQAHEMAPATVGLLAACLNGTVAPEDEAQREGLKVARASQVRRLIEANLSDPGLSAEWIARHSGLSRSALYALFEPYDGVAAYVRERRLRRALLMLGRRDGARSIVEIALEVGYGDATAFARAFRARYGMSPRAVRDHAAALRPPPGTPREGAIDRRYEAWMHELAR